MEKLELEDVFNEAGYPRHTFVKPKEYPYLKSSFKAEGKHITVAGPSGTGKTTLVRTMMADLSIPDSDVLWINARQYSELDSGLQVLAEEMKCSTEFNEITDLLRLVRFIVIDDYHFLKSGARLQIASYLKLWHERDVRFVIIGIAASADELYGVDPELGIRNDPFNIKTQDDAFCLELLALGEAALRIRFSDELRAQIISASNGVPSILHIVAKVCCIEDGVEEEQDHEKVIDNNLSKIRDSVLRIFHGKYRDKLVGLAKGKQQAKSVHNTYFDIVANIASFNGTEIPTEALFRQIVSIIDDPKERGKKATSFYNCLNNLSDVIEEKGLSDILFYKKGGKHISIEDPSFRFYLNLLDISDIKDRIHLRNTGYPYDVAVSFAGDVRSTVEEFIAALKKRGLSIFYDFDQQAQLWGADVRTKLAEVYANDAMFMVVFLSESYPERDWTDFELSVGREAAEKRTEDYLLPLRIDDVKVVGIRSTVGYVDLRQVGVDKAADLLAEKLEAANA
ncbi:TIR domain-containing protein [Marinobacter xestospongiae]|uniref:TIR domain-containing protein n=1 Tax=Marinobacter xestospongiae TaxID=994319 RepID=UPI002003C79B|nr:TIR domain-containing protein [Marinobacter xestospongiae]MCK7569139.1 TIR domain-containing protein [Marinobacter xestospongiae]